jgi:glycosyltransferase involved in cell wall biosynthesis
VTLSIVIPTRNRARLLGECLRHTVRAFPAAEIVVVDNASTDDTAVVASEFPVRYQRNLSDLGAHRNFVAAHHAATGDIVLRLADDDELDPDAVHRAVESMKRDGELVMLVAPWRMQDAGGNDLGLFYQQDDVIRAETPADAFRAIVERNVFPEVFLCRGDFARALPLPVPHIALPLLHLAFALKAGRVRFDPEPFYTMRIGISEQAGIRDCITAWDDVRGGLELLAAHATEIDFAERLIRIDGFMAGRLAAAERVNRGLGRIAEANAIAARLSLFTSRRAS